jgi:hypothetical protein
MELPTFDGTNQGPIATMDWFHEIKENLDSVNHPNKDYAIISCSPLDPANTT